MWTERWFLSCNAKDIGTCAARGCVLVRNATWYAFSSISGSVNNTLCLFPNIDTIISNKYIGVTADVECESGGGLPLLNRLIRKLRQDYAKKLEYTYWLARVSLWILSRMMRFIISNFKAKDGRTDTICSQKAESHSSEESLTKTNAQESKSENTMSPKGENPEKDKKNNETRKPSDPSASTCKRGRSPHSSPKRKTSIPRVVKGGSVETPTQSQRSRSKISNQNLRTFVSERLDIYKTKEGRYNGIIRILADPAFLQYCYMLIKGKPGNMSKGINNETLDGIDFQWFLDTANEIKSGKFDFTPARRVLIPKPGRKETRPLGVGAPREKIVQKGIQAILETIYEPKFLNCSHGFRPERSTHSALKILHLKAHQHTWVIQGDISKCFDRIPHKVIMEIIRKEISCDKMITIISKSLKVGYRDPKTKKIVKTEIGTPQGSVLSPLLANIVLHEMDKYIMEQIVSKNTIGKRRKTNPEYNRIAVVRDPRKKYYHEATPEQRAEALNKLRTIPRMDTSDPNYRRTMYVRYADDFVVLYEGPKDMTLKFKENIRDFLLTHTGLELNEQKTVITHINEGFEFLGANIKSLKHTDYRGKFKTTAGATITMRANVRARINAPTEKLITKLIEVGFAERDSNKQIKAKAMTSMINQDHTTIIQFFNSKINGIVNYYSFASNRAELHNLIWILRWSLAKTLARKFKLRSSRQAFIKFGPKLTDQNTGLELTVPRSLMTIHKYNVKENITPGDVILDHTWHSRLTNNNLFQKCVLCGTSEKNPDAPHKKCERR